MNAVKKNSVYILFMLIAMGCGLVWAFTNLGYDGEYQIAMCSRLLRGDKMFLEMWEPHQTSAFLPAALMWLYIRLLGTTTGIVVYLQICGILIRGTLAFFVYKTLHGDLSKPISFGVALLYFMISPKDYALPEFSNQQLWFSTLLLCCLWNYLKSGRRYLLILSAVFLCLEVLAYPSCAIVFAGVVLLLYWYSPCRRRDILTVTAICAVSAAAMCGYFVLSIGPDTFAKCISGMLSLEPTHTKSMGTRMLQYGQDALRQFLVLAVTGAAGFALSLPVCALLKVSSKSLAKKDRNCPTDKNCHTDRNCPTHWLWLSGCCLILLGGFLANILSAEDRCAYSVIFLFMTGVGFWHRKSLNSREKQIYCCAAVIGGFEFLATLLLSDLPLPVSVPYGLLMIVTALIPIEKQLLKSAGEKMVRVLYCCYACFILLLAFRCIYIRTPLTGKPQISSTLPGIGLSRSGPSLGLISNEAGVSLQQNSYSEWKQWIRPGDKVWIVGGVVDTLGYLYQDVEVAAPSTISTPTYNENVLAYWDVNPHKYPNVVIAESYMGSLSYDILANKWLLSWLENEFRPQKIIDGTYWRYYFRDAR